MTQDQIDWDALRARVAEERAKAPPALPAETNEPETLDQITDRMSGRDLNAIARRMFRY